MAKDSNKEQLIQKCLDIIKKENLFTISDLCAFLPFSRATYYNYGFDKLDILKNAIDDNKITIKKKLLKKWEDSNNAILQMALMKLVCSDEERKKLAMEYKEDHHTGEIVITRKVINGKN